MPEHAEPRTSNPEHRTPNIEPRTSNPEGSIEREHELRRENREA